MFFRTLATRLLPFLAIALFSIACSSTDAVEEGELLEEDIVVGTGTLVEISQTIVISYSAALEDGTVFDSSAERGEDLMFTLAVGQAIEGLDLGIQGMRVGGRRRLTIPPHMAFGRNGLCLNDGSCPVPPNATVIFDVTLLDIVTDVIIETVIVGPDSALVSQPGDLLYVEYVGIFQDGSVFDESRGGLFEFVLGVGEVISGWDRGLTGMRMGGVRLLTIPPHLAYGSRGIPGSIPPYAILKFRIELEIIIPCPTC